MHPILAQKRRLMLYLAVWLPGGLLLAALVVTTGRLPWEEALLLAFPLSQIYAFICLAAWYPSRATPLTQASLWRIVSTHSLAALFSSSIWQLAGALWAFVLGRLPAFNRAPESFRELVPLLFVAGLLLYFLASAVSYLYLAFEASRRTETRLLEAEKHTALAERELELARSIQRRLLPPAEHEGEGFQIAARNLAARFVAGDFYDYFSLPDGSLRIAVADVSGKGIAASLITATVKAILPLVGADRPVVDTLHELNRRLLTQLSDREFVALLLARFDPVSGRLELANAGLPDPYRLAAGAAPRAIEAPLPRLPLGVWSGVEYHSVVIELEPGERVLFLTDGLPEASLPSGDPLGYEALPGLMDHEAATPGQWIDRLFERLAAVTATELDDDRTALVLERAPGTPGEK